MAIMTTTTTIKGDDYGDNDDDIQSDLFMELEMNSEGYG